MRKQLGFGIAGFFVSLAGVTVATAPIWAAPAPPPQRDLTAVCARVVCRTAVTEFRLVDSAGGVYILNTAPVPYADEGRLALFAGETVLAGFPDGVTAPRFVRVAERLEAGPARTIAVQLQQEPGKADMVLNIQSTLDTAIAFDAALYIPTPNGMATRMLSSCLVSANGVVRKTWPYPVATMVLSNFREPASGQTDCR